MSVTSRLSAWTSAYSSNLSRAPPTPTSSPSPRAAEALGYSAFFRSDHYVAMSGDGLPGPTDSWVTLGGIARETSTIRLGTMVTSATFRYPGPLAISVAQVDEMSGGRVELGLGAGWFEAEHKAYAIPFPPLGERFDRLRRAAGHHHRAVDARRSARRSTTPVSTTSIADSPALPKPVQTPHPPIIIGGGGPKRTPALAAKFAAEFNIPFVAARRPDDAVRPRARPRSPRRAARRTR